MANICDFSMKIRGDKDDCMSFFRALTQDGDIYMGRGALAEINEQYEENDLCSMIISGDCKWSIGSALIDVALSMRGNPEAWSFGNVDPSNLEFITLDEACIRFNVDCEVYSSECGMCFQEHYLIQEGAMVINDCVDYYEICPGEFETRNEAEKALRRKITDEEWADKDSWISNGGPSWDFEI